MIDDQTEDLEPEDKKKVRKRSPIKERGLVMRVMAYAWPFRGLVIISMFFAMVGSFIGAASLLPMIPAIQFVIDPESVEDDSENVEKKITEKTEDREQGIAKTPLEGIEKSLPFFRDTKDYLSLKKDELREAVFSFLVDKREHAIKWIGLLLVIAVIIKATFQYFSKYFITKVVYNGTQKMKVDLYDSSLNLDMVRLTDHTSANLMSRLNADVGKVRIVFQAMLAQSVLVPFEIMFLLAFLFITSPEVTFITVFALPALIIPITIMSKTLRRFSKQDAEEDAYLMDVMQETILGIQIVKAFNSESYEIKRFRRVAKDQVKRQLRRTRLSLAAPAFSEIITTVATALVLVAGAYIVMVEKRMDAASFIVYLAALSRLYRPIKALSSTWMKLQRGLASAERVFEIVDAKPALSEAADAVDLEPIAQEIRFENINFRYAENSPLVLKKLDLVIPKGKQVAIVGGTGSGKSTLSRLIPRFYDPEEGSISIDGIDIRNATFKSLREQMAMVTQDTILFDTTIYENITYGKRNATKTEVIEAARAANADEFINKMQDGYETNVGERGNKLSGGQKQRLTIARAILRNSPILILDEATSALDNESQNLVQSAVERLMANRTVIIIAHRLSTIKNADLIVVLQDGQIAETGTHNELLSNPTSYYSRLYSTEEHETPES